MDIRDSKSSLLELKQKEGEGHFLKWCKVKVWKWDFFCFCFLVNQNPETWATSTTLVESLTA